MAIHQGIDVSEWQGLIDWPKVKAAGVDVAIIRYADGLYIDRYFHYNMTQAIKAGLHVGAYIFSRAINAAQAKEEAQRLINACKQYKYDMPLYIDLEAENLKHFANTIARAFMNECRAQGVKGGIYANLNWFNNYIDPIPYKAEPLWLAQYNDVVTARDPTLFGMWQYSSSGKVNGIKGNVDMNKVYVEYWKTGTNKENEKANKDEEIKAICNRLFEKTKQTLNGEYGTGTAREKALGSYYTPVQWIINEVFKE